MPDLVAPTARLHTAWLEAHAEWGPGLHEDGFGLLASDEVGSPAGFVAWVARLAEESDQAKPAAIGDVRCTYRWIVEGDRVLGGIALRHEFNDFVRWAGHIGYGIRPSARRRGLASWALGRVLDEARVLGMDRVLVVCEADNIASAKATERHGGVLDDVRDTEHGAHGATGSRLASPARDSSALRHGQLSMRAAGTHGLELADGEPEYGRQRTLAAAHADRARQCHMRIRLRRWQPPDRRRRAALARSPQAVPPMGLIVRSIVVPAGLAGSCVSWCRAPPSRPDLGYVETSSRSNNRASATATNKATAAPSTTSSTMLHQGVPASR